MPSPRHSPHSHTIVLRRERTAAAAVVALERKERVSISARGSPRAPVSRPLPPARAAHVHTEEFDTRDSDLLVKFGVQSMFGRLVARTLLLLLLLQPVYVAYGMELGDTPAEAEPQESAVVEEDETDAQDDAVTDVVEAPEESAERAEESESVAEESPADASADTHDASALDDGSDESGADASVTDASVIDDEPLDENTLESGSSETPDTNDGETEEAASASTTDETTDASEGTSSTEGIGATGTTSDSEGGDAESADEDATENATSTADVEHVATTTDVVPVTVDSSNKYVFGEGDCTLVAEGQFYCVAGGAERQVEGDPRVYAQQDREGDREIYYFDGVEVVRITNNGYDDFAPVFDEETQRIVWQAMINDRLQIMLHELPTHTTRQITSARENSSNPAILGDTVAWQQWVGTNWEIMTTDVDNDGAPFEIEQLTDNAVHDMFPQLYDELVTWQSERGSSWEVVVYDLKSGKRHALEKTEDTKYENPRFVLLFDSKHENGDVETIGYDLDTGEMMELGTKAAPAPVEPKSPREEVPEATVSLSGSTTTQKLEEEGEGT